MPMQAAYGYFEHDADMGIIGRGNTVEEAFVSAARAMFSIQSEPGSVQSIEGVEIDFEEGDLELALVRWLNAVLAASRERGIVLHEFGLEREGDRWRGWGRGERWRDGLVRGTEVKGATLTMLSVAQGAAGWEARCVVDV
jgi:SHS2 domain-containing protein